MRIFPDSVDDPQRVAGALADVEVAPGVERDRARVHERLGERVAAVFRHALRPVAGDRLHEARLQVHGAHAAVAEVGDVQHAAAERDVEDTVEDRVPGRPAVAAVALGARPREARDPARREVDPAHAVVERVGHVERAVRSDQQVVRVRRRRACAPGASSRGRALLARAREHAQRPALVEHADAVAGHLDDVRTPLPVEVDTEGLVKVVVHEHDRLSGSGRLRGARGRRREAKDVRP